MLKTETVLENNNALHHYSLHVSDIPSLIEKMKQEPKWTEGWLNSIVLLKNFNKQIILTALHEGIEINSFQSNESTTFHIIEGKVKFRTSKGSVFIEKGQVLTLHEKIKYSLTIKEETVLLLTILNQTLQAGEN